MTDETNPEKQSSPPSDGENGAKSNQASEGFTGKPLGHVVKALYGVSDEAIRDGLRIQEETGRKLGDVLVEKSVISPEQLAACLAILVKKETTFLSHAFLSPLKDHWWGRHLQLVFESFVVTLVTLAIVYRVLGIEESGLIAIFLASAALNTRFNVVLADEDVGNEAIDILAMFMGMFLVFVGVAITVDVETLRGGFAFVMKIANINSSTTLYQRNFAAFDSILFHNSMVLFSVFLLAFFYRGYAALLTLAWNACIWGLTLTLLFKQSFGLAGTAPGYAAMLGIVAILPHLLLEAVAYIMGAVAAIGVSKSLLWHKMTSSRFRLQIRRNFQVLAGALIILVIAAVAESYWAPAILDIIRGL